MIIYRKEIGDNVFILFPILRLSEQVTLSSKIINYERDKILH